MWASYFFVCFQINEFFPCLWHLHRRKRESLKLIPQGKVFLIYSWALILLEVQGLNWKPLKILWLSLYLKHSPMFFLSVFFPFSSPYSSKWLIWGSLTQRRDIPRWEIDVLWMSLNFMFQNSKSFRKRTYGTRTSASPDAGKRARLVPGLGD